MVSIRWANDSDNAQLLDLEEMCPQGTNLVLSFDRSPNFFARSQVYRDYRIYVAEEEGKIVGTVGSAFKEFNINRKAVRGIYIYDLRVNPNYRGKGIGSQLVQHAIAEEREADLAYGVIMEENYPSIALFTKLGFQNIHNFILLNIPIFKRKQSKTQNIRTMTSEDVPQVVALMNKYYGDRDFFAELTPHDFLEEMNQLPEYGYESIYVDETEGRIHACAGLWDYSKIFRVTALRLSAKLNMLRYVLKFVSIFKDSMKLPAVGEPFKLMYVKDMAFTGKPEISANLIEHCLNHAYTQKSDFLSFPLDSAEPLVQTIAKYKPITVRYHIYAKSLSGEDLKSSQMMYINAADL
jgi:ribosomal protein S18 acetylase RimI-like enzyme